MEAGSRCAGHEQAGDRCGCDGSRHELSCHAVRTPLLAIRTATELLLTGAGGSLAEPGRELVAEIARAGRQLEQVSARVWRLAMSADDTPRELVPVALAPALSRAGLFLVDRHGRRKSRAARWCVLADEDRLRELLELVGELLGPELRVQPRSHPPIGQGAHAVNDPVASERGAIELAPVRRWPHEAERGEGLIELRLLQRVGRLSGARAVELRGTEVRLAWHCA